MEVVQYETQLNDAKVAETLVLSEEEIKITSFWSHILFTSCTNRKFDPLFVMENIIPQLDKSFNYVIEQKETWTHGETVASLYDSVKNLIIIRSDVYEGAQNGNFLDVITVAHEVVHCIQSIMLRLIRTFDCAEFKKEFSKIKKEQIEKHEFQTDSIMRLLFLPEEITKGRTEEEIIDNYILKPLLSFLCIIVKNVGKQLLELVKEIKIPDIA